MNLGYKPNKRDLLGHMIDIGSLNSPMSLLPGAGKSGCWISIDILLESCMEGKTLVPVAAFELLTGALHSGILYHVFFFRRILCHNLTKLRLIKLTYKRLVAVHLILSVLVMLFFIIFLLYYYCYFIFLEFC